MVLPRSAAFITALAVCACTGATLGENRPGDDTYLEGNRRSGTEKQTEVGVYCRFNGSIALLEVAAHAELAGAEVALAGGQAVAAVHPEAGPAAIHRRNSWMG